MNRLIDSIAKEKKRLGGISVESQVKRRGL